MHHPAVQFVAPYRVYIPDVFFAVRTNEGNVRVKAVPLPPIRSAGASQVHGAGVEIPHDIFGFAGRTMFFVLLSQAVDIADPAWKQKICGHDRALVDSSLRAVNRVLEVYRDKDVNSIGIRSFHVLPLVRSDLSDVRLVVVDDELNEIPDFAVSWPGFRTMGFGSTVQRDAKVTADITTYLRDGIPIPIHQELMSSAQNSYWRGQYRLVPVEANTAFETFALSALLRLDPQNSLPDSSDLLSKFNALEAAIVAHSRRRGTVPPAWFDRSIPGWRGLSCPELLEWHANCYSLRNRVIHRGYNSVTDAEASAALGSTSNVLTYVEGLIA